MLFDAPYYIEINQARWAAAEKVLQNIALTMEQTTFSSCLDIGCGPGWFTQRLLSLTRQVTGLDGRPEIVEEAQRRVKEASFLCVNIESETEIRKIEAADLVFCFGLLYHTENPFRVVRNLHQLTKGVLFIETIVVPGHFPLCWLVEEGNNETQGITYHAMIPNHDCLVQMLYVSGFGYVYEYTGSVSHKDFIEDETTYQRRKIFLASHSPLDIAEVVQRSRVNIPKFDFTKENCPIPLGDR